VRLRYVVDPEPLGTAGAIKNAEGLLDDAPFLVLNGDILTDLDLSAMRTFHKDRGAEVSIALHRVEDARAFGLVDTDDDGRVRAFREKPEDPIPGDVNAGTYLLDPAVLRRWTPDRPISIEREIFPEVIATGAAVFGFPGNCYWIDLGTPEKYLQAHRDMLEGHVSGLSYEAPWIAPTADVEDGAAIDAASAVGAEARVAPGARVERSVIHPGASLASGATVADSIVGPGAHVGAGAHVARSVLGAGSRVPTDAEASGA
jgi:mannose-1-phosphate guanylyltransferase